MIVKCVYKTPSISNLKTWFIFTFYYIEFLCKASKKVVVVGIIAKK